MDFHDPNSFLRQHWMEITGLFTLGVSLWIAFGPLRHRIPPFFTRLGKYSATLKLLSLSGLCWFFLYRCLTDDIPSLAINWMLGFLGSVLLAGAIFVVTRKQPVRHHPTNPHASASSPPAPRPPASEKPPAALIRSACRPPAARAPAQP
jgi:hypothetical protein